MLSPEPPYLETSIATISNTCMPSLALQLSTQRARHLTSAKGLANKYITFFLLLKEIHT